MSGLLRTIKYEPKLPPDERPLSQWTTLELIKRAAPSTAERNQLITELERRWALNYCLGPQWDH